MPATGTFRIIPTLLVQGGSPLVGVNNIPSEYIGWSSFPDPPNPTPLIDVFRNFTLFDQIANFGIAAPSTFAKALSDTLRFSFFGNSIYLDGSLTPISFQDLPSGWTPLTATLSILEPLRSGSPVFSVFDYFLQFDSFTEGPANTFVFPFPTTLPSAINFINNGCGLRVVISTTDPNDTPSVSLLQGMAIDGTYGTQQSVSTFNPVIENDDVPIQVGDKIHITSDIPGLDGVTQIKISYNDNGPKLIRIITGVPRAKQQDPFLNISPDNQDPLLIINDLMYYWVNPIIRRAPKDLLFYLPFGFGRFTGPVTITLVGNGIQFSGSVIAGTLSVLFADASGIYVLDRNQTNDKLYLASGFNTIQTFIMLPGLPILTDDDSEPDFYSMLQYPYQIMSNQYDDETEIDDFYKDFTVIANIALVTAPRSVEIPSPFIKTAFLP